MLTEEEFLNLPEHAGKQELLDGELIELPPARRSHNRLAKRLMRLLETSVPETRVSMEMAYRLRKGRWLVPDVSVSWPDQASLDDWLQGSPMLAVEIASRGNKPAQIDRKVEAYLEHGVGEIWVIYPETRTMMVFRKDSTLRVPGGSDYHCELLGVTVPPDSRAPAP